MTIVRCGGVGGRVILVTPILQYARDLQMVDVTDRTVSNVCEINQVRQVVV